MKKTREELDEMIQNMPLNELKEFVNDAFYNSISITVGDILAEEETFVVEEPWVPYGMTPSLAEKMKKTGLTKESLLKVEQNKQKATLEEIIAYCRGLNISFDDFIADVWG